MRRLVDTLDQRVRWAKQRVRPEQPLGYSFNADPGYGGFRVKAITTKELGIILERGQGRETIK